MTAHSGAGRPFRRHPVADSGVSGLPSVPGWVLAEGLAAELESACVERLGLAVAALALVEDRHVVEAGERVGMALAELGKGERVCGLGKLHAARVVPRLVGFDDTPIKLVPPHGGIGRLSGCRGHRGQQKRRRVRAVGMTIVSCKKRKRLKVFR
jgi:hypothetical protein